VSSGEASPSADNEEEVFVAPLARLVASIFAVWGTLVIFRAVYDLFWGSPEANLYSAHPWQFVSVSQWLRYAGFELSYGLVCASLAAGIYAYSKFLPETLRRKKSEFGKDLFK
jgi:hypothetical protein